MGVFTRTSLTEVQRLQGLQASPACWQRAAELLMQQVSAATRSTQQAFQGPRMSHGVAHPAVHDTGNGCDTARQQHKTTSADHHCV
jgi:hypothetical protein